MSDAPLALGYDRGTVVVSGAPPGFNYNSLPGVLFDPRTMTHRAQGRHYRAIVEHLIREKIPYTDAARGWENKPTGWKLDTDRRPYDYQKDALEKWTQGGRRGVVVMPTGTGKTFTAFLCIEKVGRPTLVVTPTIDLMVQWARDLEDTFGVDVGMVGGDVFEYKSITVTTYVSAYKHLEKWANRFGFVVPRVGAPTGFKKHRPQETRCTLCCAAWASGRTTRRSMLTWCGLVAHQATQSAMSSAVSGFGTPA